MAQETRVTELDRGETRDLRSDRTSTTTVGKRAKKAGIAVIGGVLLVRGIRARSLGGVGIALVGAGLLSRALRGRSRFEGELRSREATDRRRNDRGVTTDTGAVSRSTTVDKPADELYEIWRDPDQLSQIMGHFAEVTSLSEDRLRWTARGPWDREITWETHIADEEPGEYLRWQTPADALISIRGSVRFREAPGDRGTQVTASVNIDPPGGALANAALDRLEIVPEALVGEALRRFKRLAENEEIPTLEGNPSARGRGDLL